MRTRCDGGEKASVRNLSLNLVASWLPSSRRQLGSLPGVALSSWIASSLKRVRSSEA